MTDVYNNPEFKAWASRVHAHLLAPLSASALTMSLVPDGETDIKFAVELGLSIMLDKPIIGLVRPGVKLPEHLVRVADAIVEFDPANPDSEALTKAIEETMARLDAGAGGSE